MRVACLAWCSLVVVLSSGCGLTPVAECGPRAVADELTATPTAPPMAQVGEPVALNGSSSFVPDVLAIEFEWTLVTVPTGSFATLNNPQSVNPTFVPDVPGVYQLRLVVGDGCRVSRPAMVEVKASPGVTGTMNAVPVANAGANRIVTVQDTVLLDGTASFDADGDPLSWAWTLVSHPAGSLTQLVSRTTSRPAMVPDLPGAYVIQLVVSDGHGQSAPAQVTVTAKSANTQNSAPVANAGTDRAVVTGMIVKADGSSSSDPDGDALNYQWSLVKKPAGSSASLSNATTVEAQFTADVAGAYELSLTVSDGALSSAPDSVVITANDVSTGPVAMLTHRVVDAEYSRALDRVITVSENPNALNIYDPVAKTTQSVTLNLVPTSVSVGPDGLFAAVGHNGWLSWVDLQQHTLIKTVSVSCDVLDIVLAGNGWAYAFPRQDQWEKIRSINLAAGTEALQTGYQIYAGTLAKLHPSGNAIYGADNGLSPSDIEKYSIVNGNAVYAYDSPYHGTYAMCGDLWISEDGLRIFTRCGNVFWTSTTQAQDMVYAGALPGVAVLRWVDHSTAANKVIALPDNGWNQSNGDTKLRRYDASYLTFTNEVVLPSITLPSGTFQTHGRWAFFDSTGTKEIVIVQVDPSSGAALDYGVIVY